MQEALFLSSPELFKLVQKWLRANIPLSDKLRKTLYKYTIRLGTRSTPYGLFAGVSMGTILKSDNNTHIKRTLQDKTRYRLDMQYFSLMLQYLFKDPTIRSQLKYNVNPTILQQGNVYKFYQQQYNLQGDLKHYLRKIKSSPILDYILKVGKGDFPYNELKDLLLMKGANNSQANDFLDKLIENGILDSELSIEITGDDFYKTFLTKLKPLDKGSKYLDVFERIGSSLVSNNSLIEKHIEIENLTKGIIPNVRPKNLIQGDLLLGVEQNVISEKVVNGITKALMELLPIATQTNNEDLEKFKEAFRERYDRQMVPLLKALDPDTGIGYGKLRDYIQPDNIISDIKTVGQTPVAPKSFEAIVFDRYLQASGKSSIREMVLSETDVASLASSNSGGSLPSTLYAMGNILYDCNPDTEPIFCLHACGGTSAANLLTRFWDLDEEIHKNIIELGKLEQEDSGNAIIAEIVHLPEARTGNILQRPSMRKAEIAVMSKCAQNVTKLDLDDLYVFVRDDKLVLWSKTLDRQVIPRLTSAHNFNTGMLIYRFLADLQSQDGNLNLKINMGNLEKSSFLPRIRYKNIILSRARWHIPKVHCRPLDHDLMKSVLHGIREEYQLPQLVLMSEGDNELLIDLSNPTSCCILFDKLCQQNVILNEYIFSDFRSPVTDGINTYANEVILPIATEREVKEAYIPPVDSPNVKREFTLGSEWVYAKIYCGPNSADDLLKEIIPSIIDTLNNSSMIQKWFFIRYKDPKHHIRLRLQAKQKENFSNIVSVISNALSDSLKTQKVHNLQFDTYIREIERYTPEHIELSEELFHWDSQDVIAIIKKFPNIEDRWHPAIRGVADYLTHSGMDITDKLHFLEEMRKMFFCEFGNNKDNDKILNLKYRRHKKLIEETLFISKTPSSGKTTTLTSIMENLWNVYEIREQALNKRQKLIASYIHMFINRLFESNQRKYEYAVYHLLSNHYRSLVARENLLERSAHRV
ncbi:lantibiotic dehydratase [Sphingobacterium lactis]|uniref:lantibiotic dehydratase n=2 Tax=Sphingobacterium TaxID=28453 RepID=UPI0021A3C102|nr:lantibiotic dehydratase [Sphingobacterium hotanense]